ncbi:calcium:proton antiporter [Tardibacter chloracetimidivorans]|uniref:Calcium:proton antiporter n=1 Tax=Tardibacter chloracetimidivorans TaxID=1921510 RepID=A0A1L3ZX23_9SPHN|nr:calcium:proton antiporter [Tardibacter chloracetimidivorans]API60149.1 calcium:proton antiporter [Tardibacter chloracetimidivorans]
MTLRLAAGWSAVAVFLSPSGIGKVQLHQSALGPLVFLWLLGVIIWCAFGVVAEAEKLAHRLGEPIGTLVLTLSIVIIEVVLVGAVMLSGSHVPTLGRDTMFAVLMIVLNGVVGLGLLVGGIRHRQQSFNLEGATSYLALIIPLSLIALVLPNFTLSAAHGRLSLLQALCFSAFTVLLYGLFLWLQTGRHKGFFRPADGVDPLPPVAASSGTDAIAVSTGKSVLFLLLNLLPIILLSKSLAKQLDAGISHLGAPAPLAGIVVAMIVFTPEGISALKAVARNELTRAINLCLGAAASTVGLTVPAVLIIGLITGEPVILGCESAWNIDPVEGGSASKIDPLN